MKKVIQFLKNNYMCLLIYAIIFILLTVKLPYYIDAPGGLFNV